MPPYFLAPFISHKASKPTRKPLNCCQNIPPRMLAWRYSPWRRISTDKNAPPEVIQFVQDEYQIAKELDAKNPSLMEEAGISTRVVGIVGRGVKYLLLQ